MICAALALVVVMSVSQAFAATKAATVTGTTDSDVVSVVVEGGIAPVEATINADYTWEAVITLEEGERTITATATDGANNKGTHSVTVTLDLSAPGITITSPQDGDIIGM